MAITLQEGLNQDKSTVFIWEIDLASSRFFRSSFKISDNEMSTQCILSLRSVAPTFYKNKFFVHIGVHIKMHIKL
jgi:hypothetical protein